MRRGGQQQAGEEPRPDVVAVIAEAGAQPGQVDLRSLGKHQQLADRPRLLEKRHLHRLHGRSEPAQLLDGRVRLGREGGIGAAEELVDDSDAEPAHALQELERLAGECTE